MMRLRFVLPFVCAAVGLLTAGAFALEPDQIALVVNRNVPASQELAEFYAKARHIPDDRIIRLNLPSAEEMTFEQYEQNVATVIREYLEVHDLQDRVTCLVTFYGVPLRIAQRQLQAQDRTELTKIQLELKLLEPGLIRELTALEKLAGELDPQFVPAGGAKPAPIVPRFEAANTAIFRSLGTMTDAAKRAEADARWRELLQSLAGPSALADRYAPGLNDPGISDEDRQKIRQLMRQVQQARRESVRLQYLRHDPAARQRWRDLSKQWFGQIGYANALIAQQEYFEVKESTAAVDSELALLWWPNYSHAGAQMNFLHYKAPGRGPMPTLMVSRLDAPEAHQVKEIVLASLRAEQQGLRGRVVVDSGGFTARDPNNAGLVGYDNTLRNFARLVDEKTELSVAWDDNPQVLPAGSFDDVALYVGNYSVRNYVPCCAFNPGAIGLHVASWELVALHPAGEKGWIHGMIKDGVAASFGAVHEPYLHAFPAADEFFPLILTGKLTLAEAYWKTIPMTSWMMSLIGDPLYTPYKTNPALKIEDLPEPLRPIFATPATTSSSGWAQWDRRRRGIWPGGG
jgi:uncharacterized protein (TIGR03790 family)